MSDQDLVKEWKKLKKQIELYNKKYEEGFPLIEDNVYDKLIDRMRNIESIIGVQKNSPLNKVGGEVSNGEKIQHLERILSLDHAFGIEGLLSSVKKSTTISDKVFPLIAEHKIDGVALVVSYSGGKMQAVTRGNGQHGINVTDQVKFVNIPIVVPKSLEEILYVRGELYLRFDDFEKAKDKFSSPRNVCAALVQNKYPIDLKVRFVAHGISNLQSLDGLVKNMGCEPSYTSVMDCLDKLGFETSYRVICKSESECIDFFEDCKQKRESNPYPLDGVVFKINDLSEWIRLGTHKTAPRYAFAVKFDSVAVRTKIIDIKAQVGKFGIITPVAIFEAIQIDGHQICRATIHNMNEVDKCGYGVGDEILVSRAGDVVPYISSKIFDAGNKFAITQCPSCQAQLIPFEKTLKCGNGWSCKDQKVARIAHFCSRNAFNIDGMGIKIITEFVENNHIQTPSDIFDLPNMIESKKIRLSKGWQAKSVANLISSIQKSKDVKLANFIFSLSIPNVGYGNAETIANFYGSFENLYQDYENDKPTRIKSIGETIETSIADFLNDPKEEWVFDLMKKIQIYLK